MNLLRTQSNMLNRVLPLQSTRLTDPLVGTANKSNLLATGGAAALASSFHTSPLASLLLSLESLFQWLTAIFNQGSGMGPLSSNAAVMPPLQPAPELGQGSAGESPKGGGSSSGGSSSVMTPQGSSHSEMPPKTTTGAMQQTVMPVSSPIGSSGVAPAPSAVSSAIPVFPQAFSQGTSKGQSIVRWAQSQLGVDGKNDTATIQNVYSQGRSEAWCANFVSTALKQSPGGSPFGHFTSVQQIKSWAQKNNKYVSKEEAQKNPNLVQPGDTVIFKEPDGKMSHVALVETVNKDGTVTTIGGNQNGTNENGQKLYGGFSAKEGMVSRDKVKLNDPKLSGFAKTSS